MLTDKQRSIVLNEMLEKLELPESAYIKAKERKIRLIGIVV